MTSEEESIEQAAIARRERLKALKAANELLSKPDENPPQEEANAEGEKTEEEEIRVKFRNYLPHDKQLQEDKLAPPVLPKFEDPVATAAAPRDISADPFINIAPKKANWDLRRDIQKKLDKLEKRTQKALYEIMREQEEQELASAGENVEATEQTE
ncbi:unnamed protein product [Victoria cruziana]